MAWMPLRFRSLQRDFATDTERFTRIREVIHAALGEADRELRGLTARIEKAREGAAFLYGNEVDSQTSGNAGQENSLLSMESTLTQGQARASHLEAQLRELTTIENALDVLLRLDDPLPPQPKVPALV